MALKNTGTKATVVKVGHCRPLNSENQKLPDGRAMGKWVKQRDVINKHKLPILHNNTVKTFLMAEGDHLYHCEH